MNSRIRLDEIRAKIKTWAPEYEDGELMDHPDDHSCTIVGGPDAAICVVNDVRQLKDIYTLVVRVGKHGLFRVAKVKDAYAFIMSSPSYDAFMIKVMSELAIKEALKQAD